MRPAAQTDADDLRLAQHGAELRRSAADTATLAAIAAALAAQSTERAGIRLAGLRGLGRHLDTTGAVGSVAVGALGPAARPVRAILFDKTAAINWSLA